MAAPRQTADGLSQHPTTKMTLNHIQTSNFQVEIGLQIGTVTDPIASEFSIKQTCLPLSIVKYAMVRGYHRAVQNH